jgi:hypothetical protein
MMANINPQGNRFSSENQPKKQGRRRNVFPFKKIADSCNLSRSDVEHIMKTLMFQDFSKVNEIEEQFPCLFTSLLVKRVRADFKNGNINTLRYMLDFCYEQKRDIPVSVEYQPVVFINTDKVKP